MSNHPVGHTVLLRDGAAILPRLGFAPGSPRLRALDRRPSRRGRGTIIVPVLVLALAALLIGLSHDAAALFGTVGEFPVGP